MNVTVSAWSCALPVAPELVETVSPQVDGDERHVGVVHRLELDAGVGAVPCCLCEQVLQGLQHLLEEVALDQTRLEHVGGGEEKLGGGHEVVVREGKLPL